jgi:hypothetical protein
MTSLYVDDAAVFLSPLKEDINNLAAILDSFAKVTGFCTNFQKISIVPIRCRHIDLDDILEGIPATHTTFPMKYLGLPLSLWQLKRVDFQHLEDKCTGKFPTWNGNLITTASHILPHPLIVPPETIKFINKIERDFLWSARETTTEAKCKVNRETVSRPTKLGALGVQKLGQVRYGSSPRWTWLEWMDPNKIWVGQGNPCSEKDMDIFYAATTISVGNGQRMPFWNALWLGGRKPKDISPLIYASSKEKKWKVHQGMNLNAWVGNISMDENFTMAHLHQFVDLWVKVHEVHLSEDTDDDIS